MQPAIGTILEITEDGGNRFAAAEVNVGSLEAHGADEPSFVAVLRERGEQV